MNGKYQVSKAIRDLCVFSKHNLVTDTPFANLDLVSCRNLLIYLDAPLQKRVFPIFHYALKPNGFLLLGTAETVGSFSNLFAVTDKESRIYARRPTANRAVLDVLLGDAPSAAPSAARSRARRASRVRTGWTCNARSIGSCSAVTFPPV